MLRELSALAIIATLVEGCGGSQVTPQSSAVPESNPTPNATIIDMGLVGNNVELYKSIDYTNGQVCYMTITHTGGPQPAPISCPVNPTSSPSSK